VKDVVTGRRRSRCFTGIVVMFRPREGPIWKGLLSVEKKKGNDVGQ
jgi:hypothetical protein